MSLRIELLRQDHSREDFDCGEDSLNEFFRRYAGQNAAKDISRTYVLVEGGNNIAVGYYTICSGNIAFAAVPESHAKKLPRYPVPTAHIGRLAVDRRHQKRGFGQLLLVDALKRICRIADQMGISAVTVYALHAKARSFYEAFGFIPLKDDPLHLFLPMATIRML